jgi:hypothetical protein
VDEIMSQIYEPRFSTPPADRAYSRYVSDYSTNSTRNGFAIAALAFGIAGAVLSLVPVVGFYLCVAPAVVAIVFGFIGLSRANRNKGLHRTEALWGVICGFLPIPLMILGLTIAIVVATSTTAVVS